MEYAFMLSQYERQLTLRVREYFISGFCERCQAQYMEVGCSLEASGAGGTEAFAGVSMGALSRC